MERKDFLIYLRVSTEEQASHGYSLRNQEEACRRLASKLGASEENIIICKDEGISGALLARPGLSEARTLIKSGTIRYFICLDPDRLARNLSHQLIVTEEIERVGTRLEFVNFEWKSTAEGKLFYSLRGAIAEYEKEKIKDRTSQGKLAKAKERKLTHHPQLYGYDFDKEKDLLFIDHGEAKILKFMYNWLIEENMSCQEIADRLNSLQIPAPKGEVWYRNTVRRILGNQSYCGTLFLRRYNAEGVRDNKYKSPEEKRVRTLRPREDWIPVEIPSIISKDQWGRAQKSLKRKKREKRSVTRGEYLLSGLLECGECGGKIHGTRVKHKKSGNQEKVYVYYLCGSKKDHDQGRCSLGRISASEVDNVLWNKVKEWLSRLDPLKVGEVTSKIGDCPKNLVKAELEVVKDKIHELKDQRIKVLKLFRKDLISEEEVTRELEGLERKRVELTNHQVRLEEDLRVSRERRETLGLSEKGIIDLLGNLDTLDVSTKRKLIGFFLTKVIVKADYSLRLIGVFPEESFQEENVKGESFQEEECLKGEFSRREC